MPPLPDDFCCCWDVCDVCDLLFGFPPVLETSLAFDWASSRSLLPLSSFFNASAASSDLRCIPERRRPRKILF